MIFRMDKITQFPSERPSAIRATIKIRTGEIL